VSKRSQQGQNGKESDNHVVGPLLEHFVSKAFHFLLLGLSV